MRNTHFPHLPDSVLKLSGSGNHSVILSADSRKILIIRKPGLRSELFCKHRRRRRQAIKAESRCNALERMRGTECGSNIVVLPRGNEIFMRPVSQKPQYGLLPAIAGTLYVSAIAVVLALIFGVACACFLDYYLPKKMASVFLAFIDLVAGIPSVIFGFIGLTVLVKAFATHLHMAAGQCILAAGIVLGIMLLPFVISTCHESLQTARKTYEFSAITLGFSREFTLLHFILPAIRPGIIAGAMMAFGRALGETMAVMMVIGNSPIYPKLLGRGQTLPALTALEMGSIEYGSLHLSVLYVANAVLLVILFIVLGISYLLKRRLATHEN